MTADQKGAIIIKDDDAMFIPFVFILSINMDGELYFLYLVWP